VTDGHRTKTPRDGSPGGVAGEKKAKGKAKGKPKGKEGTDGEGNGEEALERTTDGGAMPPPVDRAAPTSRPPWVREVGRPAGDGGGWNGLHF